MEERKSGFQQIDYTLLFLLFVLMCFSLLAIYSGSGQYYSGDPSYFVKRQAIWYVIGFVVLFGMLIIDYDIFKNFSYLLYGIGMTLLLLVSFSPLGIFRNGATSWLNLGVTEIQPSEFMKIFLILAMSNLLYHITVDRRGKNDIKSDLIIVAKVFAIFFPPFILILQEPDLGTALVIMSILATMLLMSGISWRILLALGACVIFGVVILVWLYFNYFDIFSIFIKSHQLDRFYGWLSPYEYSAGYGYQLVEALKGIGSGQLYGSGYLQGVQTQSNSVPELHTDFIFAVIGEEFGFIGATILILTYFLIFYRMIIIALTCNNLYGTYVVSGVIGFLVFQIFENIAMTVGLMPITGLALPFVSYGGSSLLTNMIAVGIVLNVGMRTKNYMFKTED
ncbi:rod shape-determining protein RodA [Halalkalibacter nanhaiisediminis]|uniref:Rod shape-determining protein RodA n=1 Tax=Halalkalibacter nanhaiisediminis TaxID=688079 RepID=A0A562QLH7_9BACI|nr:rod shape-determining protein RodA [Halalkalibacter nanhaiisediminis]TWI56906.1 rod shape-determining protein RodA [Halalkalibacter nanhaiisediminis]